MSRLREAGVRVVLVRGNHDAASQITRSLRLPDNVRELSAKKPETAIFEDLGVAVHGRSFAERAVTEDLSLDYPRRVDGAFNVGLLHTSADGRPGHEPYAPCTVASLAARGYEYWALGHVHQREVLARDPWIVFPGNLQGRHVRETGPKGATAVDVAGGVVESVEHVALDVVRWAECAVDVGASSSVADVLDAARAEISAEIERAEGRVLAARVVVRGPGAATARVAAARESVTAELRAIANDLRDVYFEKLRIATTSSESAERAQGGEWVETLATLDALDDRELAEMAKDALADVRAKLPLELAAGDAGLALDDPAQLRALLREAQQAILARARAASNEEP